MDQEASRLASNLLREERLNARSPSCPLEGGGGTDAYCGTRRYVRFHATSPSAAMSSPTHLLRILHDQHDTAHG